VGEFACMNTQHANCTHPKRFVRRFGARRRQCGACKRTWRIRQKKRGRKTLRASPALAVRYFSKDVPNLRTFAKRAHSGKDHAQLLLRRSVTAYAKEAGCWHASLPASGMCILIADAIWYRIRRKKQTIYVLLIRPVDGTEAVIVPPIVREGHESPEGWEAAYQTLPESIKARICALVCDGGTGLVALAKQKRLLLQRCQFHLFCAVQNYLTTGPRSQNRAYATKILRLVQKVVSVGETEARKTVRVLATVRRLSRSRGVRRVLGGLQLHWREYRTYLNYPKLHLPATSNTAESCIQGIRDLMYRCRGFRTTSALTLWLTAFARFKKTVRCNGKSTKLNH
jgi:hypothetical protein